MLARIRLVTRLNRPVVFYDYGIFYCPVSKTATNTQKSRFIKGEKTMAEVESFTLDHTAVKAPYVRLIAA